MLESVGILSGRSLLLACFIKHLERSLDEREDSTRRKAHSVMESSFRDLPLVRWRWGCHTSTRLQLLRVSSTIGFGGD